MRAGLDRNHESHGDGDRLQRRARLERGADYGQVVRTLAFQGEQRLHRTETPALPEGAVVIKQGREQPVATEPPFDIALRRPWQHLLQPQAPRPNGIGVEQVRSSPLERVHGGEDPVNPRRRAGETPDRYTS